MANTLTNLIPTIYEALDVVSREMVGFIPAVTRNVSAERAALNQSILVPVTQAQAAADNTPAVMPPNTGDQTIGSVAMTISRSKHVPIRWNGEEQLGLASSGMFRTVLGQQFQQAFRTLVNLIEADLFTAAYQGASRAWGNAGTAPFATASDLSDLAQLRKVLDDNGAPQTDLQLVLGSAAVANLRGRQSLLLKVSEAGSAALLRHGAITELPLEGFELHNSNAIQLVAKGTGSGYVTSGATAPGVGSIALASGTGTVNAGDIVTFAADTVNKYVVNAGIAAPGTIGIGAPGALVTIPTGNAVTVGANYTPNVAFSRSAVQLITRMPARPENGDMAEDVMTVQDPVSGLAFEVSEYRQFRQTSYHVAIAWGVANLKPNHTAILIG
ncbi:P22 coat-protein 5 family protein [Rhodovastum atsumiense]|uniref:P22 coat-protein 5 family protein n=1 Tax=Rhodovastum atsumiense TaxID=504468 RepID=A0A5M6IYP1_9PROT|nr:P22 phage major capsid protein family protein [Rhodovastum atsumiense]KAA5613463.1 P22 coat - protein 5 family protein [Rhodovastum atsumiense]CAH2603200.1 P22 coat-protein 5 family protein [Rhodovastum atsumiense]